MLSPNTHEGVFLGKNADEFVLSKDNYPIFVCGPSGSGKGTGFSIPNLLFWEKSAIVHDPKGEIFSATSGWRKKIGHKIYLWNPAVEDNYTHRYNPLDAVNRDPDKIVDDVYQIAYAILPEHEFWSIGARSLFTALAIWHLMSSNKEKTLGAIVRTLRGNNVVFDLAATLDNELKTLHPIAYMNIASFLQKEDKERSGIISLLNSALDLWTSSRIDRLTAKSDFMLDSLRNENITIYVIVSPHCVDRMLPLLRIFYTQLRESLCKEPCFEDTPDPSALLMIDGYGDLASIDSLSGGAAFYRGYGIKLCVTTQSPLPDDSPMVINSSYRIAFTPNDSRSARSIAQASYVLDNEGKNSPLESADILALPQNKQILNTTSQPTQTVDKIYYYNDAFFQDRLLPAVKIKSSFS